MNDSTTTSILGNLDEYIEICNKKISVINSFITQLYDHWFVQFDFPNTHKKPYKASGGELSFNKLIKRSIPVDWNVVKLCDLLKYLKDGTHNPPKRVDNGVPLLTGNMFGKNFLNYEKATYISEENYRQIHTTYQPAMGDIVLTKIGTIGNINLLRKSDIPIAIHCNSALLRFKEPFSGAFGFCLMKSQLLQKRMLHAKGQSIQEFISLDGLGNLLVEIPNKETIDMFNKYTAHAIQLLEQLSDRISIAQHLRDWLLPMLMNGQITVEQ